MNRAHKKQWEDWKNCFAGQKILLTGHTGFKGGWLLFLLKKLGAQVVGISDYEPQFSISKYIEPARAYSIDLREYTELESIVSAELPDLIVHFAAQSILLKGITSPHLTFSTNMMSTVNVLEAARKYSPKAIVVASSDKVYRANNFAHQEGDALGGKDPYSASKACVEHVVQAYQSLTSFPIATVRAGNVIGGGDFGSRRLVPDWIRSKQNKTPLLVRNIEHVRPWIYILDALFGYLLVLEHLCVRKSAEGGAWNIGACENISVGQLLSALESCWNLQEGKQEVSTHHKSAQLEHQNEDPYLSLSCSKAHEELGWSKKYSLDESVFWTIDGYKNQTVEAMEAALEAYLSDSSIREK